MCDSQVACIGSHLTTATDSAIRRRQSGALEWSMPFTGMVYAFHFDQEVLSARALNETPKITITLIKSNPLAYENKIELIKKAAHES